MVVNHHEQHVNRAVGRVQKSVSTNKHNLLSLARDMGIARPNLPLLKHLLREAGLGPSTGDMPRSYKPRFKDEKHVKRFVEQSLEAIPISSLKELISDLYQESGVDRDAPSIVNPIFNSAEEQKKIKLERIYVKDHNGKSTGYVVCITSANLKKFIDYYEKKLAKMKS